MDILVCVKQVPDTTEIRTDPVTNTLIRSGVPTVVNPFDKYALEAAVQLKEQHGGTVTVITMGPAHAVEALRECYSLGADRMVLVNDRIFGGSDTYATSYVLSQAVRKLGHYDLIICGKQAIDGDTAQVGPELAEHLGIPQVTYAKKLTCLGDMIEVERELDDQTETVRAPLPALVTVVKSINEPRLPNVIRRMKANKTEPAMITSADLPELERSRIGLEGSPTKVSKTFVPVRKKSAVIFDGSKPGDAVSLLLDELSSKAISI